MPLHFFWETWSCPKQPQFKGNSVTSCFTRISADWQKPFSAMDRGHNSNQITNSKNFASSCFCGEPLPNYSGFARLHHLFQKMRGPLGWYQSISFIFHSGSKEGVPEGAYSKLLQPPKRKASAPITRYDFTLNPDSHKSSSSSRSPETLYIQQGRNHQRPLGFGGCSGRSSGFLARPD